MTSSWVITSLDWIKHLIGSHIAWIIIMTRNACEKLFIHRLCSIFNIGYSKVIHNASTVLQWLDSVSTQRKLECFFGIMFRLTANEIIKAPFVRENHHWHLMSFSTQTTMNVGRLFMPWYHNDNTLPSTIPNTDDDVKYMSFWMDFQMITSWVAYFWTCIWNVPHWHIYCFPCKM